MAAAGEDEKLCYICLSAGGDLECRCSCKKLAAHPQCVARWQLQRAGTEEERTCRFCASALPSWETVLTPEAVPRAQPTLAIICQGKLVRLRLDGHNPEVFKATIRKAFNLPPSVELDVTFEAKVPGSGDRIRLKGLESYPAAMHCAAVSAGQRAVRKGLVSTQPLPGSGTLEPIVDPSPVLTGRSNSDLGVVVPRPMRLSRSRIISERGGGPIDHPSRSSSLTLAGAALGAAVNHSQQGPAESISRPVLSPFASQAQQFAAPLASGHLTTVNVLATTPSMSSTGSSMLLPATSGMPGDALCSRRSVEDRSSLRSSMRRAAVAAAQLGWLPPTAPSTNLSCSFSNCLSAQQLRAAAGGAASTSSSSSGRVSPASLDEASMLHGGSTSSYDSLASSTDISPVSGDDAHFNSSNIGSIPFSTSAATERRAAVAQSSSSQLASPGSAFRRRQRAHPAATAGTSGAEHAGRWSFASCFGL